MPDHVVDTNVLIVGSAADPGSPFDQTHVSLAERASVLEWLSAFRKDGTRALVLDSLFVIYSEYRRKLSSQDFGLLVVDEKLTQAFRTVVVEYEDGDAGTARVPPAFSAMDRSDRKFVAAALADEGKSSIVNASDSDWTAIADDLLAHGIELVELLLPPVG